MAPVPVLVDVGLDVVVVVDFVEVVVGADVTDEPVPVDI